ncbi:MAG: SRPBCC family protein [Chlorobium phaeobacteroides]|uniref:Cyclase/dehydrase n=1 Tax=Chlorobium phaeobacteroides (strain BS1) TaxID=331678 RepID=B3ENW3_CHLPB|nr:SRPBCC family protein [Chlorobium phaeobacteroides]MBL6955925.1 SRPBCC family protein [Chlorobium phaeobacteroides]
MDNNHRGISEANRQKLRDGETLITIAYLENDIINASGAVFVAARPETIWAILTDYNHLSEKIPKVVESRLVEDNGDEKIIAQTGRSGIFFIEKSVAIVLSVKEFFPRSLSFEILEGEFSVYRGEWRFEPSEDGSATFLSWQALLKPRFFAPPFLVSFVQHQDLPTILRAIRELAEADEKNSISPAD